MTWLIERIREFLPNFLLLLVTYLVGFGIGWGSMSAKVDYTIERYQRLENTIWEIREQVYILRLEVATLKQKLETRCYPYDSANRQEH